MPSELSTLDGVDRRVLRSTFKVGSSVMAQTSCFARTTRRKSGDQSLFSPCCHLQQRARGLPRSRQTKQRRGDQSLFSPCCHLRRCRPNQETMMAASRNGIMALEIAAPSPSWPAMMARWYDKVAIRCVALTGPPRVIAQISWKSVKVNNTENVITTAMIGVS